MDLHTVSQNRLRSARTAANATAEAARCEIDCVIADFETALAAVSHAASTSDQFIAQAYEYGAAREHLERLRSNADENQDTLKDAEAKVIEKKKRLDEIKASFNAAEASLNRAHTEIEASFAAATAALSRFRESAQVANKLVHKMVDVASKAKPKAE